MSIELKIKSKHLSVEAKIIRFEEDKLKRQLNWYKQKQGTLPVLIAGDWFSLNSHRRWDVRNENRATYLARAFLARRPYSTVEQKRKPENEYKFKTYIIPRIVDMVNKYQPKKDTPITKDTIIEWSKLGDNDGPSC